MTKKIELTPAELKRFDRHFRLPNVGPQQQIRIKHASALIVGAGGLGNSVAQQLSMAGIGAITLVDPDRIELSNLARQVLFSEKSVGDFKASTAAGVLQSAFPDSVFRFHNERFDSKGGVSMAQGHSLIIDCTDLPSSKYEIDQLAKALDIPLVFEIGRAHV